MQPSIHGVINIILKARFSYLFFTIIMLLLLRTFIEGATAVNALTNIFIWFIVISCVWAVHQKRKHQWIVIAMAAAAILAGLLDFLIRNTVTLWVSKISIALFLGYAVVAIFFYLAREEKVTADMVMAGASEYMLIGILWASFYFLVETIYPGSFTFEGGNIDWSGFIYFSFVTLTTTGYGDVLPLSVQARSIAVLEAITGQLFIAITVARLVSLYTVQGNKR
jgi:hypothetical protein